jgi:dTDP-4-dehydrorhamnose reductase
VEGFVCTSRLYWRLLLVHPLTRLIVIGSGGFIGSHFCRAFPDALAVGRSQLDLCKPQLCFPTAGYRYALIAAGVGNPRKCEEDPDTSYQCNVEGTLILGKELLKRGIIPIFISTDYVFDDTLKVSPLNTYGRQKAELERQASQLDALVIRLSKVYGIEKGDGTLFDEMAAKLIRQEPILAARDQVFAPIFIGDVISQVGSLLDNGARGVVNVVGPCYASRLEMGRTLAEKLGVDTQLVKEISLDELKDNVCRPKFLKLSSCFFAIPWREGIERVVQAYAQ